MRVNQFKSTVTMEGGGERVMRAIAKTFRSQIYTYSNEIRDRKIKQIANDIRMFGLKAELK